MRKTSLTLGLLIIFLGSYFLYDTQGGSNFLLSFLNKDIQMLKQFSLSFLEDIKFKDFQNAASYHCDEDQKKVNIPRLIERLFHIKPEFLDIMEYRILETSIDSTGKRARVKLKVKINILNSGKIENPELILYYHKKHNRWFMELESSLK